VGLAPDVPNHISVIQDPARYARTLLAHGVPLTLLVDLLDPPSSRDVYRAEAVADDVAKEAERAREHRDAGPAAARWDVG
jgi:uncharacterized protein (DUF58 family)